MANSDVIRQALILRAQLVFDRAVQRVFEDLTNAAPERSGATKRGLRKTTVGSSPVLAARFESTTPQGEYVEAGTKAHVILPRHGTVLVFDGGDGPVFTRHVDHPGTPPRPWFRPVLDRWPQYLLEARGA